MDLYYVTWDEKKWGHYYEYIHVFRGHSVKHVRELVQDEQNYRRRTGRPHMFHISVTKKRPSEDEIDRRKRGHLYF